MPQKPNRFSRRFASKAAIFAALASLGLLGQGANAQSFYGNLGSPSFSENWGPGFSTRDSRPQVVMLQRDSYRRASHASDDADRADMAVLKAFSQPTVPGDRAKLRHGIAYAPENAPLNVKKAIWATNTLRTKPYHWGGGHGSFYDTGYDCSGTVSFALHHAGLISTPLDSRSLMSFGERGRGRWMTIYSRNGHTFMVIAGLRLDTTGSYGTEGPRWHTDGRLPWGFEARHPVGL